MDGREKIGELLKVSTQRVMEKYLKNHHPEIKNEVIEYCSDKEDLKNLPFVQKIYHWYNEIEKFPSCKTFNKTITRFRTFTAGYAKFCCATCVGNNPETAFKRESTCMKKYGVSNVFKSETIKERIYQSVYDKHGVWRAAQIEEKIQKTKETKNLFNFSFKITR